jgi:hypothetical protein
MSKPKTMPTFGVVFAEKILGIVLLAVGIILTYETYTNPTDAGMAGPIFVIIGVILVAFGIAMILAKTGSLTLIFSYESVYFLIVIQACGPDYL